MNEPFIKNDQYNFIKRQVDLIRDSYRKNSDPTVIKAVKELANAKMIELFPDGTEEQLQILDLSNFQTDQQFDQYILALSKFVIPFPKLTEQQIKKLFPKVKKLKVPDLSNINHDQMTYLSWTDISTNKKFIVYELNEKIVGIQCKYTLMSKDNICSFCNRFGKVAYISTVTKAKKSNNPDYYKAIGNFICYDSSECNKKITNVDYLSNYLTDTLATK